MRTDDECNLCHCKGTIMHMLIKCENIKPLWRMVEDMILLVFKTKIDVNEKTLITGWNIQELKYWLIRF